ncbi:uncharacterized protein MELLADRAFT_67488 [Melampsora larici-populina 98AG31]|uniref:Uncharacterized protein n=1 Tax=Melampsora larici-populina (strain 98AG31 / pathotype 3-4-7) TaxID=747676 RepID=F4S3B3_MELLP|nr:uncharacterized protein MELLADRAFT_67488 [Melampsora larici-populina 98AG31]EGG00786.1 hypothetical protein MELLADRAFT_67488 [Melampsora larici-populina 98AG31]
MKSTEIKNPPAAPASHQPPIIKITNPPLAPGLQGESPIRTTDVVTPVMKLTEIKNPPPAPASPRPPIIKITNPSLAPGSQGESPITSTDVVMPLHLEVNLPLPHLPLLQDSLKVNLLLILPLAQDHHKINHKFGPDVNVMVVTELGVAPEVMTAGSSIIMSEVSKTYPKPTSPTPPHNLWMVSNSPLFDLTATLLQFNQIAVDDVPRVYRSMISLLLHQHQGQELPSQPPLHTTEEHFTPKPNL